MRYIRKDGKTSSYQFACGAVERKNFSIKRGNLGISHAFVELYQEHGYYHVRAGQNTCQIWENYCVRHPSQLKEARARYAELCRIFSKDAF